MGVVKLPSGSNTLKRLQLELAEDELREFDVLAAECGIRTRKELINNAMTLLRWSIRELQSGREIASIDKKEEVYKVLQMPIFDSARRSADSDDLNGDQKIEKLSTNKKEEA